MAIYRITVANGSPGGNPLNFYKDDAEAGYATSGFFTVSQSGDIGVFTFANEYHLSTNTTLINAWGSYPISGSFSGYPPAVGQTVEILLADGRTLVGMAVSPATGKVYDFDGLTEPSPLEPPVIEPVYAGQSVQIPFVLPEGAASFQLEVDDNSDFTDPTSSSWTASPVAVDNLVGTLFVRAKYIARAGSEFDSDWSNVESHTFLPRLNAPVITAGSADLRSIVISGLSVENATGYIVALKAFGASEWTEVDVSGQVDSGGNASINGLSPGTVYTFKAYAVGDGVNYSDSVYSETVTGQTESLPKLITPAIASAIATGEYTALVKRGELASAATGWRVRYIDSSETELTVDVPVDDTSVTLSGLEGDSAYGVQICALGDDVYYADSEWSTLVYIETLPPRNGNFYVWDAETTWSKAGVKKQNIMFRAKITDIDSAAIIPRSAVDTITLTVYKHTNQTVTEKIEVVEGFNGIDVPLSAILETPDSQGFNFRFVPDQRVYPIFAGSGRYEVQFDIKLLADNPLFVVYQDVIVY